MQIVDSQFVAGKVVLLRYDIDVPLRPASPKLQRGEQAQGKLKVVDGFRLRAGVPTLKLCLEHGKEVVMIGHLGRPEGEDPNLSVAPIHTWLTSNGFLTQLSSGKLKLLENLRFEAGEEASDESYAKELAGLGEVFVNEAFAAYRPAASTTLLPKQLPAAAGLRFAEEVRVLTEVAKNPFKPLIVIIGGAKIEDKLAVITSMSKIADRVLVGGKLSMEVMEQGVMVDPKVFVGEVYRQGLDLAPQSVKAWAPIIAKAGMIVWNGPLGKIELPECDSTLEVAKLVIASGARTVVGGGDTIGYLNKQGLLNRFGFASTGGGAMLKFLANGTLPTIEALGGTT